jgi:hypothetical protein
MRKQIMRAKLALVSGTLLLGIVVMGAAFAAEQGKMLEAAQPETPASIRAYERLLAQIEGREVAEPGVGASSVFPEDATDIVAGYERLFTHMQEAVTPFEATAGDIIGKDPQEWTDSERAKVAEFLAANHDLISEIRALAARGGPVHALDFSKGFALLLPHLARMRSCARLLRADAVVNATEGNYAAAVDDIIAGMKLGDALALEPILISQLVRIAIYGVMYNAIEGSLDGADLSPELTDKLMAQVAQAYHRDSFSESFAGELYFGRQLFSAVRSGDRSGVPEGVDLGPLREEDEVVYVDIMKGLIAASRLPYYEAALKLHELEQETGALPGTMTYSRQLLPALTRACQAQARHEAMLDLIQIGILLEQYRARTGSFPDTLDAIAADLGGSVPVDPFSGKSYRYRPLGATFLLYSIGANRLDDGGTHDFREGDIVWRGRTKE